MSIFSDLMGILSGIMQEFLTLCYQFTELIGFPSYGIAIILMTVIIRGLLLPLTVKQIRSMKAMQELQPRMQALQKKYKGDSQRLQQEMANLYKETGVNPLSGCLPILVQMPFLVAIFYAMQSYQYNPAYMSFLWLESLGAVDGTYILPILSAVTTYLMQKQTMNNTSKQQGVAAQQQKVMLFFMPLFIGWISLSFPSGLVIYWVVSNIFQMGMQFAMFRMDRKGA